MLLTSVTPPSQAPSRPHSPHHSRLARPPRPATRNVVPGASSPARRALAPVLTLAALTITAVTMTSAHADTPTLPKVTNQYETRLREVDLWLTTQFAPDQPGAIVIVSQDGKPLLKKAYGLADVEKKTPLTVTDVMRIASVTKPFTAMAIMLLEEENKLSVHDDITRHLPDLPTHGRKITIAHLLAHTSGLGIFTSSPKFREAVHDGTTTADVLNFIKTLPPLSPPAETTEYNNSGYYLLGAVIEKVSGMPYAEFMKKHIFLPLQLTTTALEGTTGAPSPISGYRAQNGRFSPAPKVNAAVFYAAGGVVSTANDIERWVASVAGQKLLKPATWERMMTNATLASGERAEYGYGWRLRKLRGHAMAEHSGDIAGFQMQVMMLPAEKLSLIVMSNQQHRHNMVRHVAERVAAMTLGKPFPDLQEVEISDAALDSLAGTYLAPGQPPRTLVRANKQLRLSAGTAQALLHAYGENVFFQPNVAFTRYRFLKNAMGEVTQMIRIDAGDEERVFTRAPNKVQETNGAKK
jgi:D-alanyl-D-alanine carboxypeptidase